MMLEARCRDCGDTFCPAQDDLIDDDGATARHYVRTSDDEHQGEPCGGIGEVVGQWW